MAERRDRRRDDSGRRHLCRRTELQSDELRGRRLDSLLHGNGRFASHSPLDGHFRRTAKRLPNVSVGSTLPNSTYGQSVSFTVNVSGGGPTPTGTVQFLVDGTDFGTAVTLAGGSATSPSTTLLGAGNHTVEADYSGDSNYSANSGTYTQVVNQAPLSIIPDHLSRPVGQANPPLTYAFTGFVNGDNATTAGITGSADLATTATTSSPAGDYPITVTDAGTLAAANYHFPAADFGTGTLTVTPFAASVAVGSTLPHSTYGQSVSFTVNVSGGGTDTHGNRPVPGGRHVISARP